MISKLKLFSDLLVECAVCQLAVDEFEIIEGEDNEAILNGQQEELDNVKFALLDFILRDGMEIRNEMYQARSKRLQNNSTRWVSKTFR